MSFIHPNPVFTTQGYTISQHLSGYIIANSLEGDTFKPQELLERTEEPVLRNFREKYAILFHCDEKKALARAYGLYMSRLINSRVLKMEHAFEMLSALHICDTTAYSQLYHVFKNEFNSFKIYQKMCDLAGCIIPNFNQNTDHLFLNDDKNINIYTFKPQCQHILGLSAIKKTLFRDYQTELYDDHILDSILDSLYSGSKDFRSWFEIGQILEKPAPFFDTSRITRPYLEKTKKMLENIGSVYLQVSHLSEDEAIIDFVSEPHFNLQRDPLRITFKNTPYSMSFSDIVEQVEDSFYYYKEIGHQETKTEILFTENEMLYEVWAGFEKVDYSDLTPFGPIGIFETK